MKTGLIALVLVLGACGGKKEPSCAERVATLSGRLAKPRPIEEIRKCVLPGFSADLDAATCEVNPAVKAAGYAERLEKVVAGCPDASKVFAGMASIEGAKDQYLRDKLPAAFEACQCTASPEHAGGLVEAILVSWQARP